MKYRHSFHAGNFADVHKHVTLLALLHALQRKDKGFLYLDTHAGRGHYDLSSPSQEAAGGIARLLATTPAAAELRAYAAQLAQLRTLPEWRHVYPGSPLLALSALRPQDRALLCELQGGEAHALEQGLQQLERAGALRARVRLERGDGLQQLRAALPPPERRALLLIDPPYESSGEPAQVSAALADGLKRFATGVFVAWYPIKEQRSSDAWLAGCARALPAPLLVSELWLYPRDSRVALNGSGLLIANPPYQTLERMQQWLPQLQSVLGAGDGAGSSARMLSQSAT
jgi:23S rRNA (adenine2030-N6)-methyltransferase